MNAFTKSDERIHGVAVVISTNRREIPGSTPGRYNLQIEITSGGMGKGGGEVRGAEERGSSGIG